MRSGEPGCASGLVFAEHRRGFIAAVIRRRIFLLEKRVMDCDRREKEKKRDYDIMVVFFPLLGELDVASNTWKEFFVFKCFHYISHSHITIYLSIYLFPPKIKNILHIRLRRRVIEDDDTTKTSPDRRNKHANNLKKQLPMGGDIGPISDGSDSYVQCREVLYLFRCLGPKSDLLFVLVDKNVNRHFEPVWFVITDHR